MTARTWRDFKGTRMRGENDCSLMSIYCWMGQAGKHHTMHKFIANSVLLGRPQSMAGLIQFGAGSSILTANTLESVACVQHSSSNRSLGSSG